MTVGRRVHALMRCCWRLPAAAEGNSAAAQMMALLRLAVLSAPAQLGARLPTEWHLLTNLQIGPAMALPGSSVACAFSHPAAAASAAAWELQLRSHAGAVLTSAEPPAAAELKLPANDTGGTVYTWRVRFGAAGDWSPDTTVFTTPWADGASTPPGLWAPDNATKSGPQFAFLRAALPKPPRQPGEGVEAAEASALLFVTADGPTRATGSPAGTRPILAAYKAWVGDTLVGTGPGRSKCGNNPTSGPQGTQSPALCPNGIETVYDGIDVSAAVARCGATNPCEIFIEGYGYDQPVSPTQTNAVIRRVAVELILRYPDGSRWSSVHGGPNAPALQWQAYDADEIYLANLWAKGGGGHSKGQLSSSGGGAWYYYPHEYIDMSRMPPEMTPLAYPGCGSTSTSTKWVPAVTKPALSNLFARPVPPVQVSTLTANRTTIGPGHFFFDFGAEQQGGMSLHVKGLTVPVTATVRFAEELIKGPPPAPPASACIARVQEEQTATIGCGLCGQQSLITGVGFASFGTPSGECGADGNGGSDFSTNSSCHADNTTKVLETLCVGTRLCSFLVSTRVFGEPCHKVHKWLDASVRCSPTARCPTGQPSHDLPTLAEKNALLDWRGHPVLNREALLLRPPPQHKPMGPCETGHASTDAACHSANSSCWGRPCYSMRTGSLYEDVWTLPPAAPATGVARAQNHEYIEGRYAEVVFNDSSVQPSQVSLSAFQVKARYSTTDVAAMATSHPGLDAVWELARHTSEATSLDLYADSNARQRSVDCMADDNTGMRLGYATSSQLALQRWMMKQGLTLCGTGKLGGGGCRAEWTVLPLIMVRDDLLMTGDTSFAAEHFDQLVANALGVAGTPWPIDPANGLINTTDVLIDWPSGMRDRYELTQHNSVANAFGVYGMDTLAEVAGYLGRTADAAKYKARADTLRASIDKHLWSPTGGAGWTSGGAYTDGLPCKNVSAEAGNPPAGCKGSMKTPCLPCSSHAAFHSSVYMLALGAVPQDKLAATHEFINAKILPKSALSTRQPPAKPQASDHVSWPPPPPIGEHDGMPCGVYVSQFALQALYKHVGDHGQAGLELLTSTAKNSWLNMLKQGATASMEAWTTDEKPNLTWSHVWSASPGFAIPWFLFGMQPTSPGWRTLTIKPAPGNLSHGHYTLPTVKGPIKADFKQSLAAGGVTDTHDNAGGGGGGGGWSFELSVELPRAVTASVSVPRRNKESGSMLSAFRTAYDDDREKGGLSEAEVVVGVTVEEQEHHLTVHGIGPGRHRFVLAKAKLAD